MNEVTLYECNIVAVLWKITSLVSTIYEFLETDFSIFSTWLTDWSKWLVLIFLSLSTVFSFLLLTEWMNVVLGYDSALLRLYWAGDIKRKQCLCVLLIVLNSLDWLLYNWICIQAGNLKLGKVCVSGGLILQNML